MARGVGFDDRLDEVRDLVAASTGPSEGCLDDDDLVAYATKSLDVARFVVLARHVAKCGHCLGQLNQLRIDLAQITQLMRRTGAVPYLAGAVVAPGRMVVRALGTAGGSGPVQVCDYPVTEVLLRAATTEAARDASMTELRMSTVVEDDGVRIGIGAQGQGTLVILTLALSEEDGGMSLPNLPVELRVAGAPKPQEQISGEDGRVSFEIYDGDLFEITIRSQPG